MTVVTRRDGAVGYVEIDSAPVNAIGAGVCDGLLKAVEWAEAERLERVIVSGRGRVFSAGGDACECAAPPVAPPIAPPVEPHLSDVLTRIEASDVPWIAAAHGAALGVGLELMLACRYRIAAPGTRLGLPAVMLGGVPGAGGTQRLPRLIGIEPALGMIPTGRAVTAEEAKAIGLIDEIDADPVHFAEMIPPEWLGMKVPVGALNAGAAAAEVFADARAEAERGMRGQVAPLRAIDLLEAAQTLPLAEGLARERATFIALAGSDQSKALRHVVRAERGATTPAGLRDTPVPDLREVAVAGGGGMGVGIAHALLAAGLRVTLLEDDSDSADRARAILGRQLETGLTQGALTAEAAAGRRAALKVSTDYAQAARADLAIEATFESLGATTAVLRALEAVLPPDAILASNSSCLDIDAMASALNAPARLVGLHFCPPAHIVRLLEIVRGARTSDRAVALGFGLAKTLRKVPVLAGLCDGLIGDRLLARYHEAADTVLMDGATPWEIDEAMVEFGFAMGPYEAQDLSGLDIAHAERRRQDATRDPARRYIPIADRMIELGKLGKKTGAGWYRYPGGGGKVDDPIVADLAIEEAYFARITRRDFGADEIRHRLLLAMINEAAAILGEGIALSAADIDLVTVFGHGFPRWRGGLLFHADTLGPARILQDLRVLEQEDPVAWKPAAVIEDCAARGIALHQWSRQG